MTTPEIEEFAKIVVESIRDTAIQSNDRRLTSNHAIAKRWREAAESGSAEVFAKTLIPDIVDDALFYLLRAIDDGLLKLSFTASTGETVDLSSEGLSELAGWYIGNNGWRAKFAKERFVED